MKPIFKTFLSAALITCSAFIADVSALKPMASNTVMWPGPRLILPPTAANEQPIQLQSVRINGDVAGVSATTEIDMTFFNPNRRVLEGELQFPLLDGQSISSFALDVNGTLRDAVPVEKAKGQQVFEDIIRRRVDPGLLEVTTGNNFKLRVYPLPPQGTRRVVIRVAQSLANNHYRVPLAFGDRIGRLDLDIRINGTSSAPTIRESPIAGLTFSSSLFGKSGTHRLQTSQQEFTRQGLLFIALTPANSSLVQLESFEGKNYFVADIPIAGREAGRAIPGTIGLVWDSSGSARTRDRAREFALLDAYFKKMNDGEVRLTRIRDVAEKTETFRVRGGDWRALRDALQATPYDGATNLSAFAPDAISREFLLFTDGLNNYGDKPFAQTGVPLYAISSATKSDPTFLKHVAERSGGRFIDLTASDAADAARLLLTTSTRITRVDSNEATDIVMASPFVVAGRVQVAGVLNGSKGALVLEFQHPDGSQQTVTTLLDEALPSQAAAQRFASLKVAALDAEYTFNRSEIKRLGQRFKLVTRETSLIVLELVEDYARFEIAPPAELRAEFERIASSIKTQKRTAASNHLEQIVRTLEAKVAWWNHDFPKGEKFQSTPAGDKAARGGMMGGTVDMVRRMEPPKPPESPAMRAAPAPPMVAAPSAAAPQGLERRRTASAKQDAEDSSVATSSTTIRVQAWQPDAPYAQRMRAANANELYRIYLDEAPSYLDSPAFYLDAADVFFEKNQRDLGLRVLSNLAELDLENRHILRVLGARLMQATQPALAIPVLKKVLALSPEEPQSYRDLGLAYAKNNESQRAVDTLYEVVVRPWHGRFPGVELIALGEMNAVIATHRVDTSKIDPRLLKNLPLDLRVVLTWDADNTDIDLIVMDPNGERAMYNNPMTYQGGRMSADFTGGYGPEEFSLKKAKPGKYRVEAKYFGDRRQNLTGVTTLSMQLTTGFGTRSARDQAVTLRLKGRGETVFVGEFEVK